MTRWGSRLHHTMFHLRKKHVYHGGRPGANYLTGDWSVSYPNTVQLNVSHWNIWAWWKINAWVYNRRGLERAIWNPSGIPEDINSTPTLLHGTDTWRYSVPIYMKLTLQLQTKGMFDYFKQENPKMKINSCLLSNFIKIVSLPHPMVDWFIDHISLS